MTNVSNITRQAYNATIELAFQNNDKRTFIEPEKIAYVMIEHDYENHVLPIIYISLSVNDIMYNNIINYKDTAKFYLNINKINKNSSSSISKKILSGLFNYVPSTSNPNFREDISDITTNADASYKRIMIGLVSVELTNTLRKSFNGVYNNIDQKTLIGLALDGTDCIIESIPYNESYSSILVPPLTSRYRFLEYIFNKDNFYDTMFRYFMDFEKSYLLSKNGDPVDAKDGQLDSIIVDIRSITENEAYYDGIEVKNGSHYIYINPVDSNVIIEEGMEKIANQIVSIDEDAGVQTLDLNINNSKDSDTKQTFIRTDNAALYKNEIERNSVIIEIVKRHIDGSIFTPNKSILVNNISQYSKYNGKYLMIYKKEFFKCVAGEFIMSCNVGLKKIGNIQPARTANKNNLSSYSNSSSAKKVTTASLKNTSTKAK